MIKNQDSTTDELIKFFESKINQYLEVIKVNEKGDRCMLWIDWIKGWNNEIINLKKEKENNKLI